MHPPRNFPRVRLLVPILLAVCGIIVTVVYVLAGMKQMPDGEQRAVVMFWLGKDGPFLFLFGGPSVEQCQSIANWWRTCQVNYIGEMAVALALILVWMDLRVRRRALKAASAAPVSEESSH